MAIKMDKETKFDTEAFLVTVDGEEQAIVVESFLHSFNIPTARNYREAGSYVRVFTGTSAFGIDIYVPSHNLDQAREILKTTAVAHPEAKQEPVRPRRKRHDHHERRRIARWIMLVAVAMVLAISLFAFLILRPN
jgi:hypothetical protein